MNQIGGFLTKPFGQCLTNCGHYQLRGTILKTCCRMSTLETLNFDNLALRSLPIDPVEENHVRQVSGACFSRVKPMPVNNPQLVVVSQSAIELLSISTSEIRRPEFVDYFSGNRALPGSQTAAHCYCGHQFGTFAGQLGDGAAMYLGEIVNEKNERWELQLKGSGLTPFSRTADGRKVLRSSIREFLCSEAMHFLGIPTTRASSCVTSDSTVIRDIFYNGQAKPERCTIISRIAPTFLRFGSFEIFKPTDPDSGRKGPSEGNTALLRQLLDYTVKTFYPQIWANTSDDAQSKQTVYLEFFKEVVRRTARLVAQWQAIGWCHGVLNTDNMSIVGLTIDYGPYGFLDRYDPDFICNGSDEGGRYMYRKQPEICKWNCLKFAEAIQKALPLTETKPVLDIFDEEYATVYKHKMRRKLGLIQKELPEDGDLLESFLDSMNKTGCDFTNGFRCLSRLPFPSSDKFKAALVEVTEYLLRQTSTLEETKKYYKPKMDPRQIQMFLALMQTNPDILPLLGRTFDGFKNDLQRLEKQEELKDLTEAKKSENDRQIWVAWLEKYKERLKKEEDAATDVAKASTERVDCMNGANPRFILRNYIAQNAISAAEKGDYSEVERVLRLLEAPYSDIVQVEDSARTTDRDGSSSVDKNSESVESDTRTHACLAYDEKPPDWATSLTVT
ncbi:protein adenylyltransferase SelO, mitochondrial-like [Gigantopelta aegis]|uniref:protein adenylyltransferase SelO, mitochondrial-like n=1 Tax=Gigantopelta aegis TaxID=1735272 RepID=UPI001B88A278|nr:protein adenylyltransferase SelO, mitochondrial-like [Gigantopelta aegis]